MTCKTCGSCDNIDDSRCVRCEAMEELITSSDVGVKQWILDCIEVAVDREMTKHVCRYDHALCRCY